MDHSENDILISAYLDGELTADEQLRVEQILATNADARQLVEELRALRAGLQNLPQHKLEPDFAQQVLERVARDTGDSQSSDSDASGHPFTPSPAHPPSPSPTQRRQIPILG